MRPFLTLLPAVALTVSAFARAADQPLPANQRAVALVQQLASEDFEQREDAGRGLDRLGAAALPALHAAAKHPDPEVRRRSAALARGGPADRSRGCVSAGLLRRPPGWPPCRRAPASTSGCAR